MGVTNYMTVNGKIRSEQRSGEAHSRDYVLDPLGSVIQIYQNGWPIADACYEPYGGIYTQWSMEGKTFTWLGGWGYRQTGVEWSSVYVRARHYSRGLSNWTSIDPLWPSEMAYGYVEGRVMTGVDYWGMSGLKPIPGLPPNSTLKHCIKYMISYAMMKPSDACMACMNYLTYYRSTPSSARENTCKKSRVSKPCQSAPPVGFVIPQGKGVPPPASLNHPFLDIVWTAVGYAVPGSEPLGLLSDPGSILCATYQSKLRHLRESLCEIEDNRDKYDCATLFPGYWDRYCSYLNYVIERWSEYCSGAGGTNSCLR